MVDRKYPRRGARTRLKHNTGSRCMKCGEQAQVRLDIQVNWFRGDDEVVKVCTAHSAMLTEDLLDLTAH